VKRPSWILILIIAFAMVACSKDEPESSDESSTTSSAEEASPDKAEKSSPKPAGKKPTRVPPKVKTANAKKAPKKAAGVAAKPTPPPTKPKPVKTPPRNAAKPAQGKTPPSKRSPRSKTLQRDMVKVSHLLDTIEVRQVFDTLDRFEPALFPGQPAGADYNALRLKPVDGKGFGIGVQVWRRKPGREVGELFENLFRESVGGERGRDLGESFRSEHHKLRTLTFVDRRKGWVVALTCDASLGTFDQLVTYGTRLRPKL